VELQEAAKSLYLNGNRSRYSNVYVLILKWESEDPKLPVSCEIEELCKVLDEIYHYDIEIFEIPDNRSHAKVSQKINTFIELNNDSNFDLKIVYYAGHSRLSKTRDLVWSRYVPSYRAVNLAGNSPEPQTNRHPAQLAECEETKVFHCYLDWHTASTTTGAKRCLGIFRLLFIRDWRCGRREWGD
jgi:hypothetical protein